MVATETSGPTPSALPGHVSLPFEPTSQLRLCVFRVPADRQGTREIAGTFDSGLLLPEQRREVIVRTLASMPPTQECSGPADRFAVLRAADNTGGEIYVELDHCRRILTRPMSGPPTLAQADRTLIGLLGR
ncbi:hypothetical protein ACGFIW_06450 [Micromonospora sp. NPDC048935]|uniref:hypothetical protein n=1 Tax=Micromonospora sp. NPDC048935 TaxID=3364262 RepID=UPI003714AD14